MLARQDDRELDGLVARAFDEALTHTQVQIERVELIGRFAQVNRRLSMHPVRAQVLQVLRRGPALSFFEIATLVEKQFKRLRPSRRWRVRGLQTASPAKPMADPGKLLTPGDVARELGVSARTVTNWCKKGMLACIELESGHRRIPERALASYRHSKVHWTVLDEVAARARGDEPEPDEDAIFAELAQRDSTAP